MLPMRDRRRLVVCILALALAGTVWPVAAFVVNSPVQQLRQRAVRTLPASPASRRRRLQLTEVDLHDATQPATPSARAPNNEDARSGWGLEQALVLALPAALVFLGVWADGNNAALAATGIDVPNPTNFFDPKQFQPVCSASDSVYRYLQALFLSLIGKDNYEDYAPLIAGGILRVRLELCVLESFVNEAIVPFVREKGLSWVLPLHETVETFLAGTVFAVASNFILLGSTKIVSVLGAYADLFFGLPLRILGAFVWDRAFETAAEDDVVKDLKKMKLKGTDLFGEQIKTIASGDKVNLDPSILAALGLSGATRVAGYTSKTLRDLAELADTFVGRYLIYTTVGYVLLKFVHFKVFPDFP